MRYNLKISLLLAAIMAIATGYPQQESRPGCLITPDEMRAYTDEVRMQTDALKQADKLHFYPVERLDADSISIEKFLDLNYLGWPLRNANYSDFPGWAIGNFVDLDYYSDGDEDYFEDSETEDYECGHRTYDGHQGIDIGIHPYHWKAQDDGAVEVVAAASGVIVDKREGYYDEYCVWGGAANSRGNSIVILLDDTSTATFYMHMKDGSLTSKVEGDYVQKGEYLGTVASSGNSTGPHLHFQINYLYEDDPDGDFTGYNQDAMVGACNDGSYFAAFEEQPPYDDPAVLTLETHSSSPELYEDNCDKDIGLYYDNSFTGFATVYFRSKFRDWVDGSSITHWIYYPSGLVKTFYTRTNPTDNRTFFAPDQAVGFSPFDESGTYRYTVEMDGETYSHYFAYNCIASQTLSGARSGHGGNMVSFSINSTQTISGSSANYIQYMADEYVQLNPGFEAAAGCRFVANLKGCNNSTAFAETADATRQVAPESIFSELQLYPNPSMGIVNLYWPDAGMEQAALRVLNQRGEIVYQSNISSSDGLMATVLDLQDLAKGVYMIQLTGDQQTIVRQLVLQ
ncbi:MAG: peptidoglycan DD-metalloendopeptidase family protein [Chitinophagales bacterium]|nr:peptidoglycan DD-metalloendopeptidase family protein [Chitinophagales bacterium]MCB9020890.1 peptidoglycan DD-metalloendopeptidase family protein [Chitinophagales bacterium]HRX23300.1 peptidoglycan DD-metalloendopeptidase family protein [Chitinophagales bacterium]